MKSKLRAALIANLIGAVTLLSVPAFAGPGGHMGGGFGGGFGAGGFRASGMSHVQGGYGGLSGSHISAQGTANSNGPNATDRDTGLDRAKDRRSAQGATNNKAAANSGSDSDSTPDATVSASASASAP